MNEQIEAIRNEIKRLEEIHERNLKKPMERGRIGFAHGVVECCDRILSFIDSMPESNCPKLSDTLEAAAEKVYPSTTWKEGKVAKHITNLHCQKAFKAGAKWQAEQNDKDLSEKIAAAYQLGLANKEKQMMKKAVECVVCAGMEGNKWIMSYIGDYESIVKTCKAGDKVRIIIVKEDIK